MQEDWRRAAAKKQASTEGCVTRLLPPSFPPHPCIGKEVPDSKGTCLHPMAVCLFASLRLCVRLCSRLCVSVPLCGGGTCLVALVVKALHPGLPGCGLDSHPWQVVLTSLGWE